jgi:hypothetical protein
LASISASAAAISFSFAVSFMGLNYTDQSV